MVRDEVEDQPQPLGVKRPRHQVEIFLRAELGIEGGMVDDIIAMAAARPRLQERRGIDVAHSQLGEIGGYRFDRRKIEAGIQLQTVGRPRLRTISF